VRLHVLSDLHLEFASFEPPAVAADVIVLAGDTSTGTRGLAWAINAWPDQPVLYVPGNHEFYGHSYPRLVRKLDERARGTNVTVLSDRAIDLDGVRFVGSTLWTDFQLDGNETRAMAAAQEIMLDYRRIRVDPGFRRLRAKDTVMWHTSARRWLEATLFAPTELPLVIITHHAPSARSLNLNVRDQASAAYASHLDELVVRSKARVWVHGHTHFCVDYQLGNTRVVSNQRGYPDEPAPGFEPAFVVEV
jgi:predicted phosphodiesterase